MKRITMFNNFIKFGKDLNFSAPLYFSDRNLDETSEIKLASFNSYISAKLRKAIKAGVQLSSIWEDIIVPDVIIKNHYNMEEAAQKLIKMNIGFYGIINKDNQMEYLKKIYSFLKEYNVDLDINLVLSEEEPEDQEKEKPIIGDIPAPKIDKNIKHKIKNDKYLVDLMTSADDFVKSTRTKSVGPQELSSHLYNEFLSQLKTIKDIYKQPETSRLREFYNWLTLTEEGKLYLLYQHIFPQKGEQELRTFPAKFRKKFASLQQYGSDLDLYFRNIPTQEDDNEEPNNDENTLVSNSLYDDFIKVKKNMIDSRYKNEEKYSKNMESISNLQNKLSIYEEKGKNISPENPEMDNIQKEINSIKERIKNLTIESNNIASNLYYTQGTADYLIMIRQFSDKLKKEAEVLQRLFDRSGISQYFSHGVKDTQWGKKEHEEWNNIKNIKLRNGERHTERWHELSKASRNIVLNAIYHITSKDMAGTFLEIKMWLEKYKTTLLEFQTELGRREKGKIISDNITLYVKEIDHLLGTTFNDDLFTNLNTEQSTIKNILDTSWEESQQINQNLCDKIKNMIEDKASLGEIYTDIRDTVILRDSLRKDADKYMEARTDINQLNNPITDDLPNNLSVLQKLLSKYNSSYNINSIINQYIKKEEPNDELTPFSYTDKKIRQIQLSPTYKKLQNDLGLDKLFSPELEKNNRKQVPLFPDLSNVLKSIIRIGTKYGMMSDSEREERTNPQSPWGIANTTMNYLSYYESQSAKRFSNLSLLIPYLRGNYSWMDTFSQLYARLSTPDTIQYFEKLFSLTLTNPQGGTISASTILEEGKYPIWKRIYENKFQLTDLSNLSGNAVYFLDIEKMGEDGREWAVFSFLEHQTFIHFKNCGLIEGTHIIQLNDFDKNGTPKLDPKIKQQMSEKEPEIPQYSTSADPDIATVIGNIENNATIIDEQDLMELIDSTVGTPIQIQTQEQAEKPIEEQSLEELMQDKPINREEWDTGEYEEPSIMHPPQEELQIQNPEMENPEEGSRLKFVNPDYEEPPEGELQGNQKISFCSPKLLFDKTIKLSEDINEDPLKFTDTYREGLDPNINLYGIEYNTLKQMVVTGVIFDVLTMKSSKATASRGGLY